MKRKNLVIANSTVNNNNNDRLTAFDPGQQLTAQSRPVKYCTV